MRAPGDRTREAFTGSAQAASLSPENRVVGADAVTCAEGNIGRSRWSDLTTHRGRRAGHEHEGLSRNLGEPVVSTIDRLWVRAVNAHLAAVASVSAASRAKARHTVVPQAEATQASARTAGRATGVGALHSTDDTGEPRLRGTRGREGSAGAWTRRRDRWLEHQVRKPSQRNKRG